MEKTIEAFYCDVCGLKLKENECSDIALIFEGSESVKEFEGFISFGYEFRSEPDICDSCKIYMMKKCIEFLENDLKLRNKLYESND